MWIVDKIKQFGNWIKDRSKKFWVGVVGLIVAPVLAVTLIDRDPRIDETRFGWQNSPQLENTELRTYTTKDFAHPTNPTKRIKIENSALLHYFDEEFIDIPKLPFPEGTEITLEKDKHFMLDLPEWGEAKVENKGKEVRVYDKKGVSIYVFRNPLVVEKGINPYKVVKDGIKIKETKDPKEKIETGESIEVSDEAVSVNFTVENNKLYFELPEGLIYPLEAYDDTDSNSTNTKDTWFAEDVATTNFGTSVVLLSKTDGSGNRGRSVITFDLSAGSGTISDVKLYLYATWAGADNIEVRETTGAWEEYVVTWNDFYSSYNATVIDVIVSSAGWMEWILMGTGADNPLTLTWEDTVDLFVKMDSTGEGATSNGAEYYSRESAETEKPYIEITYTVAVAEEKTVSEDIWW